MIGNKSQTGPETELASQPGIMIDNKSQISPEIELASQSEIDEIVLVKEYREPQTATVMGQTPQPDRKSGILIDNK